ncbi:MAG: alpha/beta hydrolase [Thermomicrobiales bacterium]|nr:alpha/beta hydrolase [Thermomicrobiales bacterium]
MSIAAVDLHAEVVGEGPAVLLLHGFSHGLAYWRAQRPVLAQTHRLILADLRGHGQSPAPDAAYGPAEHLADVVALLDRLDVPCVHIIGTHTGASVGLLMALEQPDRVASLVLEGAVIPGAPLASVDDALARERRIAAEQGLDAARADWFDLPFFDGARRGAAADEMRALIATFSGVPWQVAHPPQPVGPVVERFGEVRQPVALINGADDLPEFLDTARLLERSLPSANRYVIPDAGGFAAWERPEAVTPLLARILEAFD